MMGSSIDGSSPEKSGLKLCCTLFRDIEFLLGLELDNLDLLLPLIPGILNHQVHSFVHGLRDFELLTKLSSITAINFVALSSLFDEFARSIYH